MKKILLLSSKKKLNAYFDDQFIGETIDLEKWEIINTNPSNIEFSQSGGALRMNSKQVSATSGFDSDYIKGKVPITGDFAIMFDLETLNPAGGANWSVGVTTPDFNSWIKIGRGSGGLNSTFNIRSNASSVYSLELNTFTVNTIKTLKMTYISGVVKCYWKNGSTWAEVASWTGTLNSSINMIPFMYGLDIVATPREVILKKLYFNDTDIF